MPKFISTAHELTLANATLQKQADRISEPEAINANLKAILVRYGINFESEGLRSTVSTPSHNTSDYDGDQISYLRSTAASRARTQAPQIHARLRSQAHSGRKLSIYGKVYIYIDGALVPGVRYQQSTGRPHYEKATAASVQRQAKLGSFYNGSNDYDDSDTEPELDPLWDNSLLLPEEPQTPETPQDTTLEESTRLHQIPLDWTPGASSHPAICIYIPSKFTFRLLCRALILAQEAFYEMARENWPDIKQGSFPEGPHEVRFGRTEMESCLGALPTERFGARGTKASGVRYAIEEMANLRNAVCHFRGNTARTPSDIDTLLKYAQCLAVELRDEPRALKIRDLRDALRRCAEELREIEEIDPLAALPLFQPRWKAHQELLFKEVLWRIKMPWYPGDYPPAIVRVADEWGKWK
ncbi:hypothetical protein DL769_002141 [Monosporascus sp. CRB-8-3]|nr:hypothetical protein DL769_002141 [Monosporascus sp. CRB-8-3]